MSLYDLAAQELSGNEEQLCFSFYTPDYADLDFTKIMKFENDRHRHGATLAEIYAAEETLQ
jgi:hypothetical protein